MASRADESFRRTLSRVSAPTLRATEMPGTAIGCYRVLGTGRLPALRFARLPKSSPIRRRKDKPGSASASERRADVACAGGHGFAGRAVTTALANMHGTTSPQRLPKGLIAALAMAGTLAAGVAGGFAARFAHLPLPWLLGPLVAIMALSLAGVPIRLIPWGRRRGTIVVGASIGLQFTAAVVLKLVTLLPLMIGAAFVSTLIGAAGGLIFMRLTGVDRMHGVLRDRAGRRGRDHDACAALRRPARADHGGADHAGRADRGVRAVPGDLVCRRRRTKSAARHPGRAVAAGAGDARGLRRRRRAAVAHALAERRSCCRRCSSPRSAAGSDGSRAACRTFCSSPRRS